MERYAADVAEHERRESDRVARLSARMRAYADELSALRSDAASRAERWRTGMHDGTEVVVEEFADAAIRALPLPGGIALEPRVAFRRDPREIVVDIQLPDVGAVPAEKSVQYIHTRRAFKIKDRTKTEMATLYRGLIAQLPLCVLHALFGAMDATTLDSVTVNGVLPTVDLATGQPTTRYLVSVTTSRQAFDGLVLNALDPVMCLRYLGAKLSSHPLDYEEVLPFLTFELAKYRLGESVDIAAGLDGRTDLLAVDPFDFEQLIRQLFLAISGKDARVTRRSRDDGIDGVLLDYDVLTGGEFIVQAKRYRNVVPANDVRALAGVLYDKRANHAILVTSSWFSDDGRRFALDNRVRLIEGPELKHLLRQHLGIDVLIPSSRRRSGAS
jgi:restriction system protein